MKVDKRVFEMQAEICKMFGNRWRLEIIYHLKEGERPVHELSDLMGISQSNLSQHLSVMRQAGILEMRREGTYILYKIKNKKVIKACGTMREVLMEQLSQREVLAQEIME